MKIIPILFTICLISSLLLGGWLSYRYIYIPHQYLEELKVLYAIRNRAAVQNLFKEESTPIPPYRFQPIEVLKEPSAKINYTAVQTPEAYYESYKKLKSFRKFQALEQEIQSELDRSMAFEKNLLLFCLQHEDYLILNRSLCHEIETSYKTHVEGHLVQKSLLSSKESNLKYHQELLLKNLLFYEAKSYLPDFYQKETKYQDFLQQKLAYRKDLCQSAKAFVAFYTEETQDSSLLHYTEKYY